MAIFSATVPELQRSMPTRSRKMTSSFRRGSVRNSVRRPIRKLDNRPATTSNFGAGRRDKSRIRYAIGTRIGNMLDD